MSSADGGQYTTARLEQLRSMLLEEPNDVFLHYAIALELKSINNKTAAMMQLYMLLDIEPGHIPGHYQLALLFAEMDQRRDAIEKATAGMLLADDQRDLKALREFRELIQRVEQEA